MGYKIKRILVGDKQVRPAWNLIYEYSFVNKSNSQLSTDGWSFQYPSQSSYNSDGIYNSGAATNYIYRSINSLSSIKKIRYYYKFRYIGSDAGIGCTLTTRTDNSDSTQNGIIGNADSSVAKIGIYLINNRTYLQNLSAGYYEVELIYDLEAKTYKLTVNGTEYTGTISDTSVTSIRSNNGIKVYFGQRPSTTTQIYISEISLSTL